MVKTQMISTRWHYCCKEFYAKSKTWVNNGWRPGEDRLNLSEWVWEDGDWAKIGEMTGSFIQRGQVMWRKLPLYLISPKHIGKWSTPLCGKPEKPEKMVGLKNHREPNWETTVSCEWRCHSKNRLNESFSTHWAPNCAHHILFIVLILVKSFCL